MTDIRDLNTTSHYTTVVLVKYRDNRILVIMITASTINSIRNRDRRALALEIW